MTHLANIKEALTNMLISSTPSVISLSGNWGIGKSYFWHEFIKNKELHTSISRKNYSYVSLFGIDSLEQLKHTIFERTVPIEKAGEDITFSTFWDNLKKSAPSELANNWRYIGSILNYAKGLPYAKLLAPAANKALYLTVRNTLICLDDLERKGKNLRIQDVLGLVSELKEQRSCQIVLISNEDQLVDFEDYEKYREKVVDYNYRFERTPDEVFEIGFPEISNISKLYKKNVNILGILNIRIVQKLKYFDAIIKEHSEPYHEAVYEQAAGALPLLVALHYASDLKDLPSREFLKKSSLLMYLDMKELDEVKDKEIIEESKLWTLLLENYGWTHFDELDEVLDEMIARGYPNREVLKEIFVVRDEQSRRGICEKAIRDVWKRYNTILVDDENTIIDDLLSTYNTHIEVTVPGDISKIIKLLRRIDREVDADRIIDLFIETRGDWLKGRKDISVLFYDQQNIDDDLLSRLKEILVPAHDDRSLKEVLDIIVFSRDWDTKDEVYLGNVTENEFYKYFTKYNGEYIPRHIGRLMEYYATRSEEDLLGKAGRNAKTALERIAGENRLTAYKLESFGIHPNDK